MATFEFYVTNELKPKDIQRKFDAFVELYGESEAFLIGNFTELTSSGNLSPLFNLNMKIVKIGNKYIDGVDDDGTCAKIVLPFYDAYKLKAIDIKPTVKFISVWA